MDIVHYEGCPTQHGGVCDCGKDNSIPIVRVKSMAFDEVLAAIKRHMRRGAHAKPSLWPDLLAVYERYHNTIHPNRDPGGTRYEFESEADDA